MKKKVLKILAFVVAIALIIGVSVFANALVGNPISKHIATNKAEKILEDKYSDKDGNPYARRDTVGIRL